MSPQLLKQAYRKHWLVPFVGAGLSIPLKMPGWGNLLEEISARFDYEYLIEKKEAITKLIEDNRYLDTADEILKAGVSEDDLKFAICSAINRKKDMHRSDLPDNIYQDLANINCIKYLTTNYDNYLSDFVKKGPSDITHLYNEFSNEWDDEIYEGIVYNLHGDFSKPSSIVLSRKSYDNLYKNNHEFRTVLERFRERYTILFIGVSLQDEYIQRVLEVSSEKLKARHYILLANISPEQRTEMEERYNVKILRYSVKNGNHTAGIREILNEIISVSDEIEEDKLNLQAIKDNNQGALRNAKSLADIKPDSLPLILEKLNAQYAEKRTLHEQLEQKVNTLRATYQAFAGKYEEARIAASAEMGDNSVAIMATAQAPDSPSSSNKKLNVAIAGVLGIMVGVFAVFVREFWISTNPNKISPPTVG